MQRISVQLRVGLGLQTGQQALQFSDGLAGIQTLQK